MANTERLKMAEQTETQAEADVAGAEEGKTPYQKGGFLDTQESIKPVTMAGPDNTPRKWGLKGFFGRGSAEPVTEIEETSPESEEPTPEAGGPDRNGGSDEGNGGDGGDVGRGSEYQPPEGFRRFSKEQIWSREFRAERWKTVKELIKLEKRYNKERYGSLENRRYLDQLYQHWKYLEALDNKKSSSRKPFDPADLEQPSQARQHESYPPQDLTNLPSAIELFNAYNEILVNPNTAPEQLDNYRNLIGDLNATPEQAVKQLLSRYFKEAKNRGLLDGVDDALESIAVAIQSGINESLSLVEIMMGTERRPGVETRINALRILAERTFRAAIRSNREIVNLEGVMESYIQLAIQRLTLPLNPRLQPPPVIEGEFTLGVEHDEAYRTVAEGREIYWRPLYADYFEVTAINKEQFEIAVETFIRWLRTGLGKAPEEFFRKVNSFKETLTAAGQRAGLDEYTRGKRLELEALAAVIGANFSNEHYNADYLKQFWTFGSKDEGPDRMLQLIKSSKGILAAVMQKFDRDFRAELLWSPHGSRGQLMGKNRNASEMGSLQEQILAQFVAEAVGIALKRYHPNDLEKRLSDAMYEENLAEITKFMSDEAFKNLYEGFDFGEQVSLYKKLSRAREIQEQLASGRLPSDLQGDDLVIYEEFSSGGQFELKEVEEQTLERLTRARKVQQYLEAGGKPEDIKRDLGDAEALMYAEASNVVTLAYELYGAMGEKAKRGGGVFLVDRKGPEGPFRDYIPVYWAEKGGHFTENWTKATYGYLPAPELKYKVDQARRMYIWALKTYGYDAKLWDFTLLQNGKPIDPNTLGYSKYGQDVSKSEDNPFERIDRYRYAPPENPRILGYNSKGEEVILVFDNKGKPVEDGFNDLKTGLLFGQDGKAEIFDKPQNGNLIIFDNLNNRSTQASPIELKIPRGAKNSESEKVHVDFDILMHHLHNHPYSRWTSHSYWGYQEEDTGLLLSDESFAAARKIKAGELHWEDAPPHAVQLLIVDPTLERLGRFDLESLETLVTLAAVEESYQGHFRIVDELYLNFFPDDASRLKNRVEYVLQDHGGSTKQWFHMRAEAALWPDSRMRRLRTFTPFIPLHFASMSEMWGAPGGALDVFRMMGYGKYRMVGQFAFEKWVNQIGAAQDIYEGIVGFVSPQEKRSREGLGEKPTNDADKLELFHDNITKGELIETSYEDIDNKFLNAIRESLQRLEFVHQRIRVLESDMRGERAPLWLEGVDIFLQEDLKDKNGRIIAKKGDFNPSIDGMRDSGSSRHSGDIFFWRFIRWLRSNKSGEGQKLYPDVARYYAFMDEPMLAYRILTKAGKEGKMQTRWEWLLYKLNR